MNTAKAPPTQFNIHDWPIEDVLTKLADASEHLLQDHDCDMHGYEGISFAIFAARYHADRASSPAEARCVKCGHTNGVDATGQCSSPDYDPELVSCLCHGCLCKCEFPTTTAIAAREAAERAALGAAQELDSYLRDFLKGSHPVEGIERIILKHCSPVSGDVVSRTEVMQMLDVCTCGSGPEFRPVDMRYHQLNCQKHLATMISTIPAVQPVAAGGIESVTETLEEFNSTPCAVCGESGNTLPCIKCDKPLCEEHAVGTTWCPEHAPVAAGGENNNAK